MKKLFLIFGMCVLVGAGAGFYLYQQSNAAILSADVQEGYIALENVNGNVFNFRFYPGGISCPVSRLSEFSGTFSFGGLSVVSGSVSVSTPGTYTTNVGGDSIAVTFSSPPPAGIYSINANARVQFQCPIDASRGDAGIQNYETTMAGSGTFSIHGTSSAPPTVTCNASPNPILKRNWTEISWQSQNASECSGQGFDTGGGTNGTSGAYVGDGETTFGVTCAGPGGVAQCSVSVGTLVSSLQLEATEATEVADCSSMTQKGPLSGVSPKFHFTNSLGYSLDLTAGTYEAYRETLRLDSVDQANGYTLCSVSPSVGSTLSFPLTSSVTRTVTAYYARSVLTLSSKAASSCQAPVSDPLFESENTTFNLINPKGFPLSLSPGSYPITTLGTYTASDASYNGAGNYSFLCVAPSSVSFGSLDQTMTAFFQKVVTPPSLEVRPPSISVSGSCNQVVSYTAWYDPDGTGDATPYEVTQNARWSSSNPLIATSLGGGQFLVKKSGSVIITASFVGPSGITSPVVDTAVLSSSCSGGDPTIIASPNPVLRSNQTTLSWNAPGASSCDAVSGAGFTTEGAISGSDTSSNISADTLFTVRCTYPDGGTKSTSVNVPVFVHALNIDAKVKRGSCGASESIPMGDAASLVTAQVQKISPAETTTYTFPVGQQSIWGAMPATYTITSASAPGYSYCGASGGASFTSISNQQSETVTAFFVSNSALDVTLDADPSSIIKGDQSFLTWTSQGVDSCQGSGFSTGGTTQSSGQGVAVSPQSTTAYGITCTNSETGETVSDTATVTVSEPSGLACTLSGSMSGTIATFNTNVVNGSGNYGCRFIYGDGTSDIDYINSCSGVTHDYPRAGTYSVTSNVLDKTTGQTTSCGTTVGSSGEPPSSENSYINLSFFRYDGAQKKWVSIGLWDGFGVPENQVIFKLHKIEEGVPVTQTLIGSSFPSGFFASRLWASPGEYSFDSMVSPDHYIFDHAVYDGNPDADSVVVSSYQNEAHTMAIYLRKSKVMLDVRSIIPYLDRNGDPERDCQLLPNGTRICSCEFRSPQYVAGTQLSLQNQLGSTLTVGAGRYEVTATSSIPFGQYNVSNLVPPPGYRILTTDDCTATNRRAQNSSPESFGQKLSDLLLGVRSVIAQVIGAIPAGGFSPSSFSLVQEGADVVVDTYVVPDTDFCTLSASPTSIIWGQTSTLSWSCSVPDGKQCTLEYDTGKDGTYEGVLSDGREPPRPIQDRSLTSISSVDDKPQKSTRYKLSCTGVDPSTVDVNVGFLPLLREIIPR